MEEEKGEERPWSSLVADLLRLIVWRSHFPEGLGALSAVCKSWNTFVVYYYYYDHDSLPDAITESESKSESQAQAPAVPAPASPYLLLMPRQNMIFQPLNQQWHKHNIPELSMCPNNNSTLIRASNYGWLLVTCLTDVFFFNPFTRIKLQLPKSPSGCFFLSISFTSPPTSPDCEVFGFSCDTASLTLMVHTIRHGEDKWTLVNKNGKKSQPEFRCFCNPVVYKGNYCFMSNSGDLFQYNPKQKIGRWSSIKGKSHLPAYISHCRKFLVNSDRELLAVFLRGDGSSVRVLRLKASRSGLMVWEGVKDLGKRALYLSNGACFCERTTSEYSNKLFFANFCEHGNALFYSLASGKYHSVSTSASACSHATFLESKVSLAKAPKSMAPAHCTWIKPPSPPTTLL